MRSDIGFAWRKRLGANNDNFTLIGADEPIAVSTQYALAIKRNDADLTILNRWISHDSVEGVLFGCFFERDFAEMEHLAVARLERVKGNGWRILFAADSYFLWHFNSPV